LPQRYRFGRVEVRPAERRVLVGGTPAALGGRAFDVLVALIERRDRVVGKDELLDLAWPGLVVEENNLQVQVSTLRRILGPDAIATVSGHGYRFTREPDAIADAPAGEPGRRHGRLPTPLTRFIGRAREKREVAALLASSPLVTLTGFGGTGKSRLALEVAAAAAGSHADGAWLVELAPLADPTLVPQAVATALGVKEAHGEGGGDVLESLSRHLRDRRLLLVLDNCEYLVQACARLAKALLEANPHLRMLATSREALRVGGEVAYPLSPLAVGELDPGAGVEAVAANEAAMLFVDRARMAQPGFELTGANAGAVAGICRHLDGIPLAIELAAARAGALPLETIAARVGQQLLGVSGSDPTMHARQRTLRALIDWSHDLLAETERIALRRLAVFAGGWTVESAEAVAAGAPIDEPAVLDLLASLVEKSLVVPERDTGRFRLLDTVREYALERLEASGEAAAVRSRHLAWFLRLAEAASTEIVGPAQAEWLARLDPERGNFLAAHAWCDHAEGGAEQGLRLVRALRRYAVNRGMPGLARRMVLEALARPGADARTLARCRALFDAGQLGSWMGRYAEARGFLAESLAIARALGDAAREEAALQALGLVLMGLGDLAAAGAHFEEALERARALGNRRELAAALIALAQLRRLEGRPDAAGTLYGEAAAIARELGDRETIAIAVLNLAMVAIGRWEPERSREAIAEALAIASETGSRPLAQGALDACAGLAAARGQWAHAARFCGMAGALLDLTGLHRDPADEAFLAPRAAAARQALGDAAFDEEQAAGRAAGPGEALAEAREWISRSGRTGPS
jgi:predicted ATPase/DNA-binding winged helix-turn-helix (wHTH) protein